MKLKTLLHLLLCCSGTFAADYKTQTVEKAHGMFHAATNAAMYAEAAQQYEYLVTEEGIHNGHLFYTLGNSWFMAADMGRAILNYRRAECYLPNHDDVRHNLQAALEQRIDLISAKERHPLAAKLLGWHFNTSVTFRWWFFACCWLIFWSAWRWRGRTRKKEVRTTTIVAGILSLVLLASLSAETLLRQQTDAGVIIAAEVLARKGDGETYARAFLDPLHSGTEFQRLESRGTWWYIRLADGQKCWIPASAAATVSL